MHFEKFYHALIMHLFSRCTTLSHFTDLVIHPSRKTKLEPVVNSLHLHFPHGTFYPLFRGQSSLSFQNAVHSTSPGIATSESTAFFSTRKHNLYWSSTRSLRRRLVPYRQGWYNVARTQPSSSHLRDETLRHFAPGDPKFIREIPRRH